MSRSSGERRLECKDFLLMRWEEAPGKVEPQDKVDRTLDVPHKSRLGVCKCPCIDAGIDAWRNAVGRTEDERA